jgi:hypothetical protein
MQRFHVKPGVAALVLLSGLTFVSPAVALDLDDPERNATIYGTPGGGRILVDNLKKACPHLQSVLLTAAPEQRTLVLANQTLDAFHTYVCDGYCDLRQLNLALQDCRDGKGIARCVIYGAVFKKEFYQFSVDPFGTDLEQSCKLDKVRNTCGAATESVGMKPWTIVPFESVGPLRFGMTPAEVAVILGPPETSRNDVSAGASKELHEKYKDYIVEHRVGTGMETIKPSIQYKSGRLVSVEFFQDSIGRSIDGLTINGIEVFQEPKSATNAALTTASTHYADGYDDLIFLDFGISMSKDETWEYAPSVNIFAKGEFDDLVAKDVASGAAKIVKK